jgi:hypothetical protein
VFNTRVMFLFMNMTHEEIMKSIDDAKKLKQLTNSMLLENYTACVITSDALNIGHALCEIYRRMGCTLENSNTTFGPNDVR